MKPEKILLASAMALLLSVPVQAADSLQLKQEAASIVKRFGGTLKPALKKALKSGGPAHAVKVCSEEAPAIAAQLSKETGWSVRRVSLKNRNPGAVPDAWERGILEQFDQRQANGEAAAMIAYAEVTNGQYRFMKAQGVEPVCMTCHAAKVAPEVEEALKAYYPNDKALGYSLGQIRGAFSLAKDL